MDGCRKPHLVKWDIICRSKKEGGMGVLDFRNMNKALLGKWLWRLLVDPEALWSRVIREKYYPACSRLNLIPRKRVSISNVWRNILEVVEEIKESLQFVPGNGVEIRFWKDAWLNGSSPASLFPNLFRVAIDEDDLIRDSFMCEVNSIIWMPRLRRNLSDEELEEFSSLLGCLH
ncbi:hypothetical protein QJS04_geneDACA014233 [Acorus gramineus]|uniref:Uncharacterized protein n=1 Tax=Acorus gramineus TaxID=55184 RepID=A0AAV9BXB1_ACOGR|nr:hypothetical protein QJS04_geneDACA014233 [Acorus gramineus]